MGSATPYRDVEQAINAGDIKACRKLLDKHAEELLKRGQLNDLLRHAAGRDSVVMVELLVDFGADVNAPRRDGSPEGAICEAAGNGAIQAVRWLLAKGARVNQRVNGVTRCFALTTASFEGHLDVVKLLVEGGGAELNAVWKGRNALSLAITYDQKEVLAYLRSKGALEPWQLTGEKDRAEANPVLDHICKFLGKPTSLSLQAVVTSDPNIKIHCVQMQNGVALVTTGMSDRPMTVPDGGEGYRFAELIIYLPAGWPLGVKDLQKQENFWPIEWLRRIASYPHEHQTWLRGKSVIFANGDPPKPLASNTQMTCVLAITETESEFGQVILNDGRQVVFYTLCPLYTEERDYEKKKGIASLLEIFQKHKIGPMVNVSRQNVGKNRAR